MTEQSCDVLVVGGGAAGLSGAMTLARARRRVLVVDAGHPRNAPAAHVHNYLGRDGLPPTELLAVGRAEVEGYGGRVVAGTVVSARPTNGGFRVTLADGTEVRARRLLVTTGLVDELPDVPGLAERWGRDVLHCPYCHGWEVRDRTVGVLATGPLALHQVQLFRQLTPHLTLLLHDAVSPTTEEYEQLAARGIRVVAGKVARLRVEDDALTGVELADGTAVPLDALAVSPRAFARADVLTGLGLETAEMRIEDHLVGTYVPADPTGATTMPGVWVAGNVADLMAQVGGAAAAGVRAGAAINADLIAEEVRTAVAARRAEGFWEEHYRGRERVGSGNPNPALVDVAGPLPAGTALDLGSGEGDDARWLAERGWRVTAVDVSATALERAGRHAAAAGVADRVDWQRHDLAESFPDGSFDLVSSHYLHSPVEFPRDRVLRAAAAAVAPGGLLLVVGHAEFPPWAHDHDHVRLPTPDDVLAALDLPPDRWKVELAERRERGATGPNGETGTLVDSVVAARRI